MKRPGVEDPEADFQVWEAFTDDCYNQFLPNNH